MSSKPQDPPAEAPTIIPINTYGVLKRRLVGLLVLVAAALLLTTALRGFAHRQVAEDGAAIVIPINP